MMKEAQTIADVLTISYSVNRLFGSSNFQVALFMNTKNHPLSLHYKKQFVTSSDLIPN